MIKKLVIGIVLGILFYNYIYYTLGPGRFTEGRVVKTLNGLVKGSADKSREGREFYQWLGVPYGQPPVGQLRFACPQPVKNWEGVFDATKYGNVCPQIHMGIKTQIGHEDCLHLNIYAPKDVPQGTLLDVMVFIHGGGFLMGAGGDYAPDYFMTEDVLLITINYRFGIFGFLTTGDEHIRGNMGLKDQAESLRWIKKNVEYFGGNPNSITVFGESAGGASVHYMTLSDKTRGLFNRAMSLSGTALLPWAFSPIERAVAKTKSLARDLNCPTDNTKLMTDCLRELEVWELLQVFKKDINEFVGYNPSRNGDHLPPTLELVDDEEAFLTQEPYDILAEGKAYRIPWMTGILRDEGLVAAWEFYRDSEALEKVEKNFEESTQKLFSLSRFPPQKRKVMLKKLREFYFPGKIQTIQEKWDAYTEMYSDGLFLVGTSEVADLQRKFSPVYLYYNDRRGGPGDFSTIMAELKRNSDLHPFLEFLIFGIKHVTHKYILGLPDRDDGVGHAQDLGFLFPLMGIVRLHRNDDHPDYKFSRDLIKFFISFARDENKTELRGQRFLPLSKKGPLKYFNINENPKVVPEPFVERKKLWREFNCVKLYSANQTY